MSVRPVYYSYVAKEVPTLELKELCETLKTMDTAEIAIREDEEKQLVDSYSYSPDVLTKLSRGGTFCLFTVAMLTLVPKPFRLIHFPSKTFEIALISGISLSLFALFLILSNNSYNPVESGIRNKRAYRYFHKLETLKDLIAHSDKPEEKAQFIAFRAQLKAYNKPRSR